jgi:hypothetical protein
LRAEAVRWPAIEATAALRARLAAGQNDLSSA